MAFIDPRTLIAILGGLSQGDTSGASTAKSLEEYNTKQQEMNAVQAMADFQQQRNKQTPGFLDESILQKFGGIGTKPQATPALPIPSTSEAPQAPPGAVQGATGSPEEAMAQAERQMAPTQPGWVIPAQALDAVNKLFGQQGQSQSEVRPTPQDIRMKTIPPQGSELGPKMVPAPSPKAEGGIG
jgi:hypothetical protein